MSKQAWRYAALENNTRLIEAFCKKHRLTIEYLNDGYQLRINGVIDIYPVRLKYHYLKNGQRGEFETMEHLDLSIFDNVITVRNGVMSTPPNDGIYTPDFSMPSRVLKNLPKPTTSKRKWWQIWRKK